MKPKRNNLIDPRQLFRVSLVVWCIAIIMGPGIQLAKSFELQEEWGVREILNEARRIAILQDDEESFWIDRVLAGIANNQIKAGDFEGAKKTIGMGSNSYENNRMSCQLAKALARAGKRERSLEVLRELGSDHSWNQDILDDDVRTNWLEFLIDENKLERAQGVVDEMVTPLSQSEGFRKLAVAHVQNGDRDVASRLFDEARSASNSIPGEFLRAREIWNIANTQLEIGDVESAKATAQELVSLAQAFENQWARVSALREAASLAAKADDRDLAASLFTQAIAASKTLDRSNPQNALSSIAQAQASVEMINDALKTAGMIKHSEEDFTIDGKREKALRDIAIAQANAGDRLAAMKTALSIDYYIQYENDALMAIVDLDLRAGKKETALSTAKQIANPSRRAVALFKVATEYAREGDMKTAKAIAGRIELKVKPHLLMLDSEGAPFDYQNAETWGVMYEQNSFFTSASHSVTVDRARESSAAAMTFAQTIDETPIVDYAERFEQVRYEEVIQSLARAHATYGDAQQALAWARRIGSSVRANDQTDEIFQVQQRIHALIGVAEGMLERQAMKQGQVGDAPRSQHQYWVPAQR